MTRLITRLLPARPRRRTNRALPALFPAVDPWAEGEAYDPLIDTLTFPRIGASPMSDTTDKVLGRCETCAGDIEYVPTPEGADPEWFRPFWRYTTFTSPTPCVAKPRPADVEAVR